MGTPLPTPKGPTNANASAMPPSPLKVKSASRRFSHVPKLASARFHHVTDRAFCLLNCPSRDSAAREGSCLEFAALFREDAAASASPEDPLVFRVSGLQPTDADSEPSADIGEPFGSAREAFLPGPPPAFPRWYPSPLKPEFPPSKATSTDEVIAGQRLALAGLRSGGEKECFEPGRLRWSPT